MIDCPHCHGENYVGTLFCGECGAQLFSADGITQALNTAVTDIPAPLIDQLQALAPVNSSQDTAVILNFVENGRSMPLSGSDSYILGRPNPGETLQPDINLNAFDAYKFGVSRIHAQLNINGSRISLSDLGSVNGTRINGQRIDAHSEHMISNGDLTQLGKLKFQLVTKEV